MQIKNNLYRKNLNNVIKQTNSDIRKLFAEHDTNKKKQNKKKQQFGLDTTWLCINNAQLKIKEM